MKIKIIKCSNSIYWYRNEIGKIFEVFLVDKNAEKVYILKDYKSFGVDFGDYIEVNELEELENRIIQLEQQIKEFQEKQNVTNYTTYNCGCHYPLIDEDSIKEIAKQISETIKNKLQSLNLL
jgi:hypothetical protein